MYHPGKLVIVLSLIGVVATTASGCGHARNMRPNTACSQR